MNHVSANRMKLPLWFSVGDLGPLGLHIHNFKATKKPRTQATQSKTGLCWSWHLKPLHTIRVAGVGLLPKQPCASALLNSLPSTYMVLPYCNSGARASWGPGRAREEATSEVWCWVLRVLYMLSHWLGSLHRPQPPASPDEFQISTHQHNAWMPGLMQHIMDSGGAQQQGQERQVSPCSGPSLAAYAFDVAGEGGAGLWGQASPLPVLRAARYFHVSSLLQGQQGYRWKGSNSLLRHLPDFFNSPKFSDVVLKAPSGKALPAHSVVLSAGSRRFAAVLEEQGEQLPKGNSTMRKGLR